MHGKRKSDLYLVLSMNLGFKKTNNIRASYVGGERTIIIKNNNVIVPSRLSNFYIYKIGQTFWATTTTIIVIRRCSIFNINKTINVVQKNYHDHKNI